MTSRSLIEPGSTIGVLGSGQLGRMLALAAARLGYRVHVFSDAPPGSPAGQVAQLEVSAAYSDETALREFAAGVNVVTVEFENIPAVALELLGALVPVRPDAAALHVTQNRLREKRFLEQHDLPHAPFVPVSSKAELRAALQVTGWPAVLKTAGFGYDGKGQLLLKGDADLLAAAELLEGGAVLEAFVEFEREVSVLLARSVTGETADWGVINNTHVDRILDLSVAGTPAAAVERATGLTRQVAEALDFTGLLCVEFFETAAGELLVNEIAPRAHNSGHLTIEASVTSQFEQQVRAICGLPFGATQFVRPAAMTNLLGDLWTAGTPDWSAALSDPDVKLHLYGKSAARPGRKMGHLTALAPTPGEAAGKALAARERLA